uniref:Uncharacterized protein n=1 Tax=Anguilla anguilla TaxID=7936 RepID=A0A0E9W7U2_ANGAN
MGLTRGPLVSSLTTRSEQMACFGLIRPCCSRGRWRPWWSHSFDEDEKSLTVNKFDFFEGFQHKI